MEPGAESTLEERAGKEATASAMIRHLADHAQYEAALLFTRGQYVLYYHSGVELICKGLSAQTLRAAFVEEPVDSGWLPEGVVRWGSGPAGTFMVKYIPPGKQHLHLSTQNPAEPLIIAPMLPALVFAGVQSTYYVWALSTISCDPQAPLCHAPLPNVYPDGHICFGSNRPPMVSWETLDEAWRLFLDSPFNADMVQGKSQAFPGDVRRQLAAVASSEVSHYPQDDLRPFLRHHSFGDMKELRTLDDVVEYYLIRKGTQR
jgi:PRTRC genetic system protein B